MPGAAGPVDMLDGASQSGQDLELTWVGRLPAGLCECLAGGGRRQVLARLRQAGRQLPSPGSGDEPVPPDQCSKACPSGNWTSASDTSNQGVRSTGCSLPTRHSAATLASCHPPIGGRRASRPSHRTSSSRPDAPDHRLPATASRSSARGTAATSFSSLRPESAGRRFEYRRSRRVIGGSR